MHNVSGEKIAMENSLFFYLTVIWQFTNQIRKTTWILIWTRMEEEGKFNSSPPFCFSVENSRNKLLGRYTAASGLHFSQKTALGERVDLPFPMCLRTQSYVCPIVFNEDDSQESVHRIAILGPDPMLFVLH